MWILIFARWCQHYLQGRGTADEELEELAASAAQLVSVRSMDEWRRKTLGIQASSPHGSKKRRNY